MTTIRYIKFENKGERLWLIITQINDEQVISHVWNHPINIGVLIGQLIGVPFKDDLDTNY